MSDDVTAAACAYVAAREAIDTPAFAERVDPLTGETIVEMVTWGPAWEVRLTAVERAWEQLRDVCHAYRWRPPNPMTRFE